MRFNVIYSLCILLLIEQACSTLGPGDRKKKSGEKTKTPEVKKNVKKAAASKEAAVVEETLQTTSDDSIPIFDLGLVRVNTSIKKIVNYHEKARALTTDKLFKNKILSYVTPWNNKGYDMAKKYANKFDMISPVWLQVKRIGRNSYQLAGVHDIDKGWMKDVRESSEKNNDFLPRIIFEKLSAEDLHAMFNSEEEKESLSKYFLVNLYSNFKSIIVAFQIR